MEAKKYTKSELIYGWCNMVLGSALNHVKWENKDSAGVHVPLYQMQGQPKQSHALDVLGRDFSEDEIVVEANLAFGHENKKLKRLVAAVDGAFQEMIDAKSVRPPAVLIDHVITRNLGSEESPLNISCHRVFIVFKIDRPLEKLPIGDDLSSERLCELALRNYEKLNTWRAKTNHDFGVETYPELAFTTNPNHIEINHRDRELEIEAMFAQR